MTEVTLKVRDEAGKTVFSTGGKWLHPLFELEDFLSAHPMDVKRLFLEDKIIGLGAAALIVGMGFTRCRGGVLSERAIPLLEKYGVAYEWGERVERIGCRTEDIITVDSSLEDVYADLSRRAGRSAESLKV